MPNLRYRVEPDSDQIPFAILPLVAPELFPRASVDAGQAQGRSPRTERTPHGERREGFLSGIDLALSLFLQREQLRVEAVISGDQPGRPPTVYLAQSSAQLCAEFVVADGREPVGNVGTRGRLAPDRAVSKH